MRKYDKTLLQELEALDPPQADMTQEERNRLENAVLARVAAAKRTAAPRPAVRAARRAPRRLAGAAAAVAAVSAFSLTAYAVGPALLQMLQGKVGFFAEAPAAGEVDNAADAPRGTYDALQTSIEAYNAPVGQTVTCSGVTITLDNISMDAAGMDVFFTVTGERAVKGVLDPDDYQPEWSQLGAAEPRFWEVTVNGEAIAQKDTSDFYRVDDNTLKLWCHYLLAETPAGETVSVQLAETSSALGVEGEWRFDVALDGASVRAGGKTVAPGTYETGSEPLTLSRLAFGPVGGVVGTEVTETPITEGVFQNYVTHGLPANMLYIVDDTGRELAMTKEESTGSTVGETTYYNLIAPDPAATALTVTPVLFTEPAEGQDWAEQRTVTTEELQNGAKIETSPIGGYTVQNFKREGSAITMDLVPYGWTGGRCLELMPDDEGLISMVASSAVQVGGPEDGQTVTAYLSALCSSSFDPKTGVFTLRFDYYAATEEELAQITTWHYYYESGYSLDTAHAVTLPLEEIR